jgi:hypothetical protein
MNPFVYQGFKLIDTPGWWIMAQTIALQHFEPLSTIIIPEEPKLIPVAITVRFMGIIFTVVYIVCGG